MFDIKRLEKARIIKGWSKVAVAKNARISAVTYTHIINGKNQYPPTIKKVADALGLDMKDLYIGPQK